jgi:hypothetical protein
MVRMKGAVAVVGVLGLFGLVLVAGEGAGAQGSARPTARALPIFSRIRARRRTRPGRP